MKPDSRGTLYAGLSYVLWGLLPLYWKALQSVGPQLVLAHRIFWALLFTTAMVVILRLWREVLSLFQDPRKTLRMLGAAALISFNWWLYIWAVHEGHVVESALGYYINPLVSVVLGIVFLKERLSRAQIVAFCFAVIGVVVMTWGIGQIPFVALGLALSFGFYGLLKKQAPVSGLASLQVETLFSLPLAVVFFVVAGWKGIGGTQPVSALTWILLVVAGPVTALPLWLFGAGARLIPLVRLGFLQYISPTLSLFLGVVVFHEAFGWTQGLAFGCIWVALVVFSVDSLRRKKREP